MCWSYLVDEVGVDPVAKDLSGMSTIHAVWVIQLEVVKVGHTHTHSTAHTHTQTCTLDLSIAGKTLTHTHTCTYTHTLSQTQHKYNGDIASFFAVVGEEDWFQGHCWEDQRWSHSFTHCSWWETHSITHSLQITSLGSFCHPSLAHGCTEMLQFFLDNLEDKNDINVLYHIHATAAHDAAEFGQQETLLMLLKHGANISIKDTVSALQLVHVQAQHMLIIIHWGSPNHWVLNLQCINIIWEQDWKSSLPTAVYNATFGTSLAHKFR